MRNHELTATTEAKSHFSQQVAEQPMATAPAPAMLSPQYDPLAGMMSRFGDAANATAHATVLNRAIGAQPTRSGHSLLQLQRHYGNHYVQRVLSSVRQGDGEAEATPEIERAIQQARGGGQTLDSGVRIQMESAFSAEFSGVHVHTGVNADTINRALGARAFTTGQDIFFRQGEYSPGSSSGRQLLAHELTHVVQQAGASIQTKLIVGAPGDEYEQEADQTAARVMRMLDSNIHVQRQCACGGTPGPDGECTACRQKRLAAQRRSINRVEIISVQRMCSGCTDENDNRVQISGLVEGNEEEATIGGAFPFTGVPGIQLDLAVDLPNPGAVPIALSAAQIDAAIRFNRFRFKDPWDIRNVRDVMGLNPYPAIIDEEFVLGIVQWQAEHNLPQDGQVGAETTRTFLRELQAEGARAKATDLARDNFVTTPTVAGPTFNNCGALPRFRWDVALNTSLRNGFIIQQIDNVFNPQTCAGATLALPPASTPTPRYWEAWQVNNAGNVTPLVGGLNDRWQRFFPPGSRGNWRMTGTFFTVLRLPIAAGFAGGAVHDAGILQSTVTAPNRDDLGSVAGQRTIGGTWDCCPPNNTHTRT